MHLLKLTANSQSEFVGKAETGMGYHFVRAGYRLQSQASGTGDFLVLGSTFAVPVKSIGGVTSFKDLLTIGKMDEFSKDALIEGSLSVIDDFAADPLRARAALIQGIASTLKGSVSPPPPIPSPGTSLTVKTKSTGSDAFLRFSYTRHDPRIGTIGTIAANTYATSFRDGMIITSGLSAVGRYALPVPLPAEFVFVLMPPAGTDIHFGAAVPVFGQAGGGVEAYFPTSFKNATRCFTIPSY